MLAIRNDNWLIDPSDHRRVRHENSPNQSGALVAPAFIVLHWTAGRGFNQSVGWLCSPASKASAHLVIGRKGEIAQLVPFDRRAWHAGKSAWGTKRYPNKPPTPEYTGLNQHSIGIEFDNHGPLRRTPKGWQYFNTVVPDEDVELVGDKGYHAFTAEQLLAGFAVCGALIDAYPSIVHIVGHSDIAPGRKSDPGPAFPMESFKSWLEGRADTAP